MASRFPQLSEEEIESILEARTSENTKKSTKVSLNIFRQYLQEREILEDDLLKSKTQLANVLRRFYAEARKKNSDFYTKASLLSIRFGLQRFFSSHNMDIIKETEFNEANRVFSAELSELKREGKAKTEHKPAITKADITKLYESGLFNINHPETLQNKVFFEVMLFFCRRGRQNLRQLQKDDFHIGTDTAGVKYVYKAKDELTKNHRENDEAQETQAMFAIGGPFCPVLAFEKYVSHLNPKNEYLFQRPSRSFNPSNDKWYDNMVVGQRTLGDKMKTLSKAAKLSYSYTNHSIRATAITILDECGFEARHIMAVSGHRSENSIRSYATRTSLSTKRKMSETLSTSISNTSERGTSPATSNTSTIVRNAVQPCITGSPILSASQENYILNDLQVQQSSNESIQVNYYNCTFNYN